MSKSCSTACLIKGGTSFKQSRYSSLYVIYQRSLRYVKIAGLLHTVSLIGLGGFLWFSHMIKQAALTPERHWSDPYLPFCALYGLVLIVFSQADARSRFQNYKQVKDLLYEKGFNRRIIMLFSMSRCQRDALKVAAKDLGMLRQLKICFSTLGYRWFHVLPDFIFRRPQVLLMPRYWHKTLFAKTYQSRYFLW